jgi:hypothetical protein
LILSPSLASQPRCAAAMHCVSSHVYASRTLTHSCVVSQEVQLMRLAKEAEKLGILAMRLGEENIPIQPVHPVPPGMRFAHAVAAETCGSPIDFGRIAQDIFCWMGYWRGRRHMPQTSELRKMHAPHALSVAVRECLKSRLNTIFP